MTRARYTVLTTDIANGGLMADSGNWVASPSLTSMSLPVGTIAQRPTYGNADRAVRLNSETGVLEFWNGSRWIEAGLGRLAGYATGRLISDFSFTASSTIHVFPPWEDIVIDGPLSYDSTNRAFINTSGREVAYMLVGMLTLRSSVAYQVTLSPLDLGSSGFVSQRYTNTAGRDETFFFTWAHLLTANGSNSDGVRVSAVFTGNASSTASFLGEDALGVSQSRIIMRIFA